MALKSAESQFIRRKRSGNPTMFHAVQRLKERFARWLSCSRQRCNKSNKLLGVLQILEFCTAKNRGILGFFS